MTYIYILYLGYMDALNTFLALLARTEGRDKVIFSLCSSLGLFNLHVYTHWNTNQEGPPSKFINK